MQIPLNYSPIEKGLIVVTIFIGMFAILVGLFGGLVASFVTLLLIIVTGLLLPKS